MLDRLPSELVDHILDFTDTWPEEERPNTFYRLSLVNKKVGERAQKALYYDLRTDSTWFRKKLVGTLQENEQAREAVKALTIVHDHAGTSEILETCPNVQRIVFDHTFQLSVSSFKGFKPLPSVMVLTCVHMDKSPALDPICLPNLVELTISFTYFRPGEMDRFFNSAALPSLKALAISLIYDYGGRPPFPQTFPNLPLDFVAQLDMLQISSVDLDYVNPAIFRSPTPILLTTTFITRVGPAVFDLKRLEQYTRLAPPHICFAEPHAGYFECAKEVPQTLECLINLAVLVSSPSKPFSLQLPHFLQRIDAALIPETSARLEELMRACGENGVEVVWHSMRTSGWAELRKDFWRYAKAFKEDGRGVRRM
ncbi:hypothetical protein JCM8547_004402 [Rhodosporidiobolus lusitaniae]